MERLWSGKRGKMKLILPAGTNQSAGESGREEGAAGRTAERRSEREGRERFFKNENQNKKARNRK